MAVCAVRFFRAKIPYKGMCVNAKTQKQKKIQFGGNKHYGKKILLSLHGRQCEDA